MIRTDGGKAPETHDPRRRTWRASVGLEARWGYFRESNSRSRTGRPPFLCGSFLHQTALSIGSQNVEDVEGWDSG
eukprot:1051005-Rhodomonas_salina.1